MPKKKAVFGQLTLTGEVAVDWMKAGTEVTIGKVEIGPIEVKIKIPLMGCDYENIKS